MKKSGKEKVKNPKERIIVALDTADIRFAKKLVRSLKDSIKIFKVGSELFTAQGWRAVDLVESFGGKVFLDLKFHDIPATVAKLAESLPNEEYLCSMFTPLAA